MKSKEEHSAIKKFASAIQETSGVPMSIYDMDNDKLTKLTSNNIDINNLFTECNIYQQSITALNKMKTVQISNEVNCFWLLLPAEYEERKFAYIMGPVLIAAVSRHQVIQLLYKQGLPITQAQKMADEYEQIPIVSYPFLMNIYSLLYFMIYNVKADTTELVTTKDKEHILEIKHNEEDIYHIQQRNFEEEINAEKYLLECVRNGDLDSLKSRVDSHSIDLSSLAPDELRSLKNMIIISISLVTRAAVQGGLPVESAFPLSDYYIMQIELAKDMASIVSIQKQAVLDFAGRVKNNAFKLTYSKLVNRCCGYIVANVHRRISVSELAEREHVHPDTLIRRFKKETGKTVVQYARHIKMKEAKTLLEFSDKSITDIAALLGFSSQSQFIHVFKESAGKTPSDFRKTVKR